MNFFRLLTVTFFFLVSYFILKFPIEVLAQDDISKQNGNKVAFTAEIETNSKPVINIWYGTHQKFGQIGVPQRWVNILGNVSEPGVIRSLKFSLNEGPELPLSIGPDKRRLLAPGDFNIEIIKDLLDIGINRVVINAIDNHNNETVKTVAIDYKANTWPLPYSVDWKSVTNIQDVVQVVDGLWILDGSGIRTHPEYVGYDRVIAIGDMTWKDYEVTVPITIHAIDTSAYGSSISIGPAFGINVRWLGHTDSPVACPQPHCGWDPMGASNWYSFRKDLKDELLLIANPPGKSPKITTLQLEMDKTYWFKARVETITEGSFYRFKVWEDGIESEPSSWTLRKLTTNLNLTQGSFLLVAHHVDATFGNVTVISLEKKSLRKLIRKLKMYLVQFPFFIVWIAGIVMSLKYWNRYPKVSHLTLIAILILSGESIIHTYLNQQLPVMLQQHELGTRQITRIFFIKDFIQALLTAAAWTLLIVAMFRWRSERDKGW